MTNVNNGEYTARLGKWVSKKSYDRSIKKVDADKMAVAHEIARPEEETMNTMPIGSNIGNLEFAPGKPEENVEHKVLAKQEHNTTSIEFHDMVVEHSVSGREIGSKQSESSYVFFAGTSFSAPVNLLILRHRLPEESK